MHVTRKDPRTAVADGERTVTHLPRRATSRILGSVGAGGVLPSGDVQPPQVGVVPWLRWTAPKGGAMRSKPLTSSVQYAEAGRSAGHSARLWRPPALRRSASSM